MLAEKVGFEPTVPFKRHTRFPGEPLQPLGHLSGFRSDILLICVLMPGQQDALHFHDLRFLVVQELLDFRNVVVCHFLEPIVAFMTHIFREVFILYRRFDMIL